MTGWMPWLSAKIQRYYTLTVFVGCLGLLVAIYQRGREQHLHQLIDGRLMNNGITGAVSFLYHHGTPYAIHCEVFEAIHKGHWTHEQSEIYNNEVMRDRTNQNNQVLRDMKSMPVNRPEQVYHITNDDKGIFDFAVLSMVLFGPKVEGFYKTVILILLTTVVAFFVGHWARRDFCLVPLVALSGIFATIPALSLVQQSCSLSKPTGFEFVGLIPCAHLALSILSRQRFSFTSFGAASFQAFVLTECIHVRATASWFVVAILGLYLGNLAWQFVPRLRRASAPAGKPLAVLRSSWVIALFIMTLLALKVYQSKMYDVPPGKRALSGHVVWHSIAGGFVLHPELARVYEIDWNDGCIMQLVKKRLEQRSRGQVRFRSFPQGQEPDWTRFIEEDLGGWRNYDNEVRAVLWDIVREHPMETLSLFLYHKPKVALRTFAWAAGLCTHDLKKLYLDMLPSSDVPSPDFVRKRSLHVRFFDLCWLTMVLVALARLGGISARLLTVQTVVFFFFLGCSMLPLMATFPIFRYMGGPIFSATTCLLSSMVAVVSFGVSYLLPPTATGATMTHHESNSTPI